MRNKNQSHNLLNEKKYLLRGKKSKYKKKINNKFQIDKIGKINMAISSIRFYLKNLLKFRQIIF